MPKATFQDLMRQLRRVAPPPPPVAPTPEIGPGRRCRRGPVAGTAHRFRFAFARAPISTRRFRSGDRGHLEVQRHLVQGVRNPSAAGQLQAGRRHGVRLQAAPSSATGWPSSNCVCAGDFRDLFRKCICRPILVWDLQEATWDIGIAAGHLPLLDAPADWWHAPLQIDPAALVERYSRAPAHLDVARRLRAGPVTPSRLRTDARLGVSELRRVLQACLMSGVVRWVAN
jgi:hypothetical protein